MYEATLKSVPKKGPYFVKLPVCFLKTSGTGTHDSTSLQLNSLCFLRSWVTIDLQ